MVADYIPLLFDNNFSFSQALDFLAIAVHELASISERRIERLCNPSLSELPAFLVNEGGLNSGFMIAHCTAAALGLLHKAIKESITIKLLNILNNSTLEITSV